MTVQIVFLTLRPSDDVKLYFIKRSRQFHFLRKCIYKILLKTKKQTIPTGR
jgi:hypothetical protein